ncbi:hypothetical protein M0802_006977 [Mischocyttarus mexicanus]|nr:hypothetical protein M0802_006977 [Mischocyttarus mexicanus]
MTSPLPEATTTTPSTTTITTNTTTTTTVQFSEDDIKIFSKEKPSQQGFRPISTYSARTQEDQSVLQFSAIVSTLTRDFKA